MGGTLFLDSWAGKCTVAVTVCFYVSFAKRIQMRERSNSLAAGGALPAGGRWFGGSVVRSRV